MENKIFQSEKKEFKTSDSSIYSFKDCPNRCVDGYVVDPYTHKRKLCSYCAEKRKSLIKTNSVDSTSKASIKELLNLPEYYLGYDFNIDSVFPDYAIKYLEETSLLAVKELLSDLVTKVSVGDLPKRSYMFNLGSKVYETNFIYPYLMRAYMAGVTVSPLVYSLDLVSARTALEAGIVDESLPFKYRDLLRSDICICVLDAGATKVDIGAVKGLMQLRASNNKPTIIFTNLWNRLIGDLCDIEADSMNVAKLISVEYVKSSNTKQVEEPSEQTKMRTKGTMSEMSSSDFRNLLSSHNNL